MGRELKRVPMDFDWPQGIVWKGYLNPYRPTECKVCEGEGYNEETREIARDWYDFEGTGRKWCYDLEQPEVDALLEKDRLWDFTRRPLNQEQADEVRAKIEAGGHSWLPYDNGYRPTPDEVNQWAQSGFGHDALNRWICVEARAKSRGVYGLCPLCEGVGSYFCDPKYDKLYDEWEEIEPPEGEGFQMWETTTEGSPQSPVFATLDKLCEWLEATGASVFGGSTAGREDWKRMLSDGLVYHREGNNIFM